MQTQTSFSGLAHDDAGDFKKRVQQSLDKLKGEPTQAAKTETGAAPGAAAEKK